ncbi:hypothetical protein ADL12_09630 [Streptomyces regalis]|uniref:Uncharacterized protein n=1 Tax=Streptomyces regalis TaxID=68262 RepID=A0A0X3VD36_9ACTN|nr:hypothetical protein ADL12_09630 [Streptomyces regalis]
MVPVAADAVERAADRQRAERRAVSAVVMESMEDRVPPTGSDRQQRSDDGALDRAGRLDPHG